MPVGKFTVLDIAMRKIGGGVIDLDTDSFNVVLTTSAQAITAAFTGTSTDARYSDLTAEATGTGYTAGGAALVSPTWTQAPGVTTFNADPTSWTALDTTFKYGLIVKDGGNDDIVGFFDVDDASPTGRTIASADFVINWTGGVFTLTRVD